jgi:hypothetical protein
VWAQLTKKKLAPLLEEHEARDWPAQVIIPDLT